MTLGFAFGRGFKSHRLHQGHSYLVILDSISIAFINNIVIPRPKRIPVVNLFVLLDKYCVAC